MKLVRLIALSSILLIASGSASWAAPPLRNPFRVPFDAADAAAPNEKSALSNSLELTGILWAGEDSLANVSGEILAIGESIDGYVLVEVSEDGAVFERSGSRYAVLLTATDSGSQEKEL